MSIYESLVKTFIVDESKLPDLNWLSAGEHFIPVYFSDILEKVLSDEHLSETEREKFKTLAEMFAEHYHLDYHKDFLALKQSFAPFDPDKEVQYERTYSEKEKETCRENLVSGVRNFLGVCNYCEMSSDKLAEILEAPYPGVLTIRVDMKKLEFFQIFYRGVYEKEKKFQSLFFLKKIFRRQIFKRIFILARYNSQNGNKIIAKVFRDVPIENLKVVVPEVKLLLPFFDKIKVGGSLGGAMGTALYKILIAATLSPILFSAAIVTFSLACFRSVMGFFNSRMKCLKTYSESLYHQSLAGNMGAVNLLVEQAETQEVKEAFLAYFMLYISRNENLTMNELDGKVEAWLQKNFGFYIDFEVDDALRKLAEKNLAVKFDVPEGESGEPYYKVYDLPSSLRRLDEMWDNYHLENNEGEADTDLLAR